MFLAVNPVGKVRIPTLCHKVVWGKSGQRGMGQVSRDALNQSSKTIANVERIRNDLQRQGLGTEQQASLAS